MEHAGMPARAVKPRSRPRAGPIARTTAKSPLGAAQIAIGLAAIVALWPLAFAM